MSYVRPVPASGPSWLKMFTSTLAAVLIGGVVLGLGFRAYVHWSVMDTIQQVNEKKR